MSRAALPAHPRSISESQHLNKAIGRQSCHLGAFSVSSVIGYPLQGACTSSYAQHPKAGEFSGSHKDQPCCWLTAVYSLSSIQRGGDRTLLPQVPAHLRGVIVYSLIYSEGCWGNHYPTKLSAILQHAQVASTHMKEPQKGGHDGCEVLHWCLIFVTFKF